VSRSTSDSNAISYVLPVLRMTSYFQIMVPMGQHQRHGYSWLSLPGADTGGKVSVYNALYADDSPTVLSSALLSVSNHLDFKSLKMSAEFRWEINCTLYSPGCKYVNVNEYGVRSKPLFKKHGQECEKKYPHSSDHRKMDLQTD